CQKYSSSPWTF
nr:immunoglobulin light chain junction region [Macaca mulatta]MOW61771.1 immunoglobulin light chain junction region [Macaca mulatta]MOW61970.1 immunoglobulin light chain junction region [Macaca mulatta]MOW61993.1 immunoglobulin light chain junction region [Macaca mulatta]MOW62074.1 immunoglobulin light chain junction region [Macaca mulatta]